MKKRNVFELLALKEKLSVKKLSEKLYNLSNEQLKVSKILEQLDNLSENNQKPSQIPAWKLKSDSNIQEKINQQKEIAKYKLLSIKKEKDVLTKNLSKHEIKRKKSLEKSNYLKNLSLLEKEKKIEDNLRIKNEKNNYFRWH